MNISGNSTHINVQDDPFNAVEPGNPSAEVRSNYEPGGVEEDVDHCDRLDLFC